MTVALHPSIDNGIKQGSGNFAGGTLVCKWQGPSCQGPHQGRRRPQPCLRLHQVLEAARRDILRRRRGAASERHRARERRQASDSQPPLAMIPRCTCKACGAHVYGRIGDKNFPTCRLDFIHLRQF